MVAEKRGPRPSSVVCPVCKSPVLRACTDKIGGGGNTVTTHPERRVLAASWRAGMPERMATGARHARATIRLGNAVVDCLRAGVSEGTIIAVVRSALSTSLPSSTPQTKEKP